VVAPVKAAQGRGPSDDRPVSPSRVPV